MCLVGDIGCRIAMENLPCMWDFRVFKARTWVARFFILVLGSFLDTTRV